MNGVNKQHWTKLFYGIVVFYILLIIGMVYIINHIPINYENRALEIENNLKKEIKSIILLDIEQQEAAFSELHKKYDYELILMSVDRIAYQSIPIIDFKTLDIIIEKKTLSYQGTFVVKDKNNEDYQAYLAIYKEDPQDLFVSMLYLVIAGVILLCLVVIALIVIIFKHLIAPLRNIKASVNKLSEYRLDEVNADNLDDLDVINHGLVDFAHDLKTRFDDFGSQYSILELQLKSKEEQYIQRLELVRGLIHDSKTQFSVANLKLDQIKADTNNSDVNSFIENNNIILDRFIEIIAYLNPNLDVNINDEQDNDLSIILKDMLKQYRDLIKNKKAKYELDIPLNTQYYYSSFELKQVIHNIISNAIKYVDDNGLIKICIDDSDEYIDIFCYNEYNAVDNIDFNKVFDLFYCLKDDEYSTGIGLYTIKKVADKTGGFVTFTKHDKGILLQVRLYRCIKL